MTEIKIVNNDKDLNQVFKFLSKTIYDDTILHKEKYYPMSERLEEIKNQLKIDKGFLMYIEEDNNVVAAITGKNMDLTKKKITLGILAVSPSKRRLGYATKLIREFEKISLKKGITHIDLGSRYRASSLYEHLNYKYSLMVQIFDFVKLEDIRKANRYNLKEISSNQDSAYGYILYKVPSISKKYISCFEKKVPTAIAQYIFEKNL